MVREVSQNLVDARFVPAAKTREHLMEAIDVITRSIDSPKNEANISVLVDLLLKRAIAHDLLNDQVQRQADIIQAYRLEPHDADACVKYAVLLDEQKNTNEAIRILEGASPDDPAKLSLLLLAQLLAVRNASNDRERALDIVDQEVGEISARPEQFSHIVEFYVRLSISIGKSQRAETFLSNVTSKISSTLYHVLVGRIRFGANNRSAAKASALAAKATLDSGSSRFDRLQLGWLFHSLQEHQQVVDTLREIVKPNVVTDDAIRLLQAAQESDEVEFALQFCAGLRSAGVFDRQCVDLEIGLLFEAQCLQTATAITNELIAAVRDDEFRRELIVRRSILGIETDHQSLIETDPLQLPAVETVNAALGRMTAMLIHRTHPLQAIEYAYELVRRHFNHPDVRKAMIAAFGFGSGAESRVDLPTYETVQPGTAVGYQETGSENTEWRIIEDSPNPKTEFNELSPDHELAQELMGKRVEDEFYLRKHSVQDRVTTIREIIPKYVYRLRECLDSWEERFPKQFFVQQIQVKQSPDGQPDLSPIFNSVDRRIQQTQTIDSLYRENPVSLYTVADAQGASIVSVITHIADQQDLEIKCCLLSDSDVETLQKLPLAQRIVLDPSFLATLFLTDTFDKIIVPNGLWTITEATHREISRWRQLYRESNKDGGFVTKIDGRHVLLPNDAWDHSRIIERFERFEAIVEDRISIEPGDEILQCGKTLRQQLVGFFGLACAQSIATAMRPGYLLWTDDLVAGVISADSAKCHRVWTQGVVGWLVETGQIKSEIYDELSLRFVEANYAYTLISPSIVILAAKKSNWNANDLSLKKCIAWFSNRATRPNRCFNCSWVPSRQYGPK